MEDIDEEDIEAFKEIRTALRNSSMSLNQCVRKYPVTFIKHFDKIGIIYDRTQVHRDQKPYVLWLYGETGVGKTQYAYTTYGRENVYKKNDMNDIWPFYENQGVVIIDAFCMDENHTQYPWTFEGLIKIIDGSPLSVNCSWYNTKFNSPLIIINSIKHPKDFFPKEEFSDLYRNIDAVILIISPNEAVDQEEYSNE